MGPSDAWSKRADCWDQATPFAAPSRSQCSPHSPLLRFAFQMACSLSVFGRSGSKQIPASTKLASCMHSGVALSSQNMRFRQPGDQPATKTPLCLSHFAPIRNPSGVALSRFPHFWNPTAIISPHAYSRLPRIRTSPLRSRKPRVKKQGNGRRRRKKTMHGGLARALQSKSVLSEILRRNDVLEQTPQRESSGENTAGHERSTENAPWRGRSSATGLPARWVGWLRYAGLCGV